MSLQWNEHNQVYRCRVTLRRHAKITSTSCKIKFPSFVCFFGRKTCVAFTGWLEESFHGTVQIC